MYIECTLRIRNRVQLLRLHYQPPSQKTEMRAEGSNIGDAPIAIHLTTPTPEGFRCVTFMGFLYKSMYAVQVSTSRNIWYIAIDVWILNPVKSVDLFSDRANSY